MAAYQTLVLCQSRPTTELVAEGNYGDVIQLSLREESHLGPRVTCGGWRCPVSLLKPRASFSELTGRKELHRRAAKASTGKGQRFRFPARFSHDRDPGDLVAMGQLEIQIVPIRAFFPALKIFEDREHARLCPGVNRAGRGRLDGAEFGAFHHPAAAQDINVIRFELDGDRHGLFIGGS